ncbi:uncharacterized protein RJT21DRAFT_121686 [Scheffersomyces amazonensis]|uniref:uncharacterized protein n=1 Tax=Scheffersomyces amazonensis TaxID=1078765 RepID=UPI00315C5F98
MTYTIGDRKITLEHDLSESDIQLLLAHSKLFKYCLNMVTFKYLINLKKIVHLYGDVITIYSTLLSKIPNYDDITLMSINSKISILQLENNLSKILGVTTSVNNTITTTTTIKGGNWEDKEYENNVKKFTVIILESTIDTFALILKTLRCVEVFFSSYSNLKKLLVPFLLNQTISINDSLRKALYLFKLTTIADDIVAIKELTPPILKQLKKIEKITTGIERESAILLFAFKAFNDTLKKYTSVLIGKAILKREIPRNQCELINRREVCLQAAEHVVSIPLTEDQVEGFLFKNIKAYLYYGIATLSLIMALLLFRLFKLLFGPETN